MCGGEGSGRREEGGDSDVMVLHRVTNFHSMRTQCMEGEETNGWNSSLHAMGLLFNNIYNKGSVNIL